jgi:hypothetical protein
MKIIIAINGHGLRWHVCTQSPKVSLLNSLPKMGSITASKVHE